MKKGGKAAMKKAEELGYRLDSTNSKGFRIFVHPCGHEIAINPSADEQSSVRIIQLMQRAVGEQLKTNKRNPLAVRERQAVEREKLRQRIEAHRQLLTELSAKRLRVLAGIPSAITSTEVLAIEAQIEKVERECREWHRLMVAIPAAS